MRYRKALALSGLLAAVLIVVATLSQGQTGPAQFDTGKAGLAWEDDKLLVAIPLKNISEGIATNVSIANILLGPQPLLKPASLPLALGDIPAGKDVLLQLAFSSVGLSRVGQPPLIIIGSLTYAGRTQAFQVQSFLTLPPPNDGVRDSVEALVPAQDAEGGNYPPSDTFDPMDANPEQEGLPLPEGKQVGDGRPDSPTTDATADDGGGYGVRAVGGSVANREMRQAPGLVRGASLTANTPVTTVRWKALGVQGGFGLLPWDPSGASVDVGGTAVSASDSRLVFLTGNTYVLISTDGGAHFSRLNPTTLFPNNFDGGMCCDQVVQYVPSIDRIVWLMQFSPVQLSPDPPIVGRNRIRIAAASPAQIIASGGKSWKYWDMTSYGTFNFGDDWIDYPDMAFSNKFLYMSIDRVNLHGLFVIRVPLADIQASAPLHIQFTNPGVGSVAYFGHLAQDSPDAAYWFGHVTNSSLRVFEWPDSSPSYNWRTLTVDTWSDSDYESDCQSGGPLGDGSTYDPTNWLAFHTSAIRAATVQIPFQVQTTLLGTTVKRVIKIAWSAARDSNFPEPYVRVLDIVKETDDLGLITNWYTGNRQQIWNSKLAYQFPYMTTNSNGEVGISLTYGGGYYGTFPSPVVGFVGDYHLYVAGQSSWAIYRWGDYTTIRKHGGNTKLFSVSDYYLQAPASVYMVPEVVHQYRLFGRTADVGGTY